LEELAPRLPHRRRVLDVAPVQLVDQPFVRSEVVARHVPVNRSSDSRYPQCVRILAVPVKSLSRAKSRLARVLSPMERAALTLAMLEDVLDATLAQSSWETWVISRDEAVLEIAARRRARPVLEEKPPLSAAVR